MSIRPAPLVALCLAIACAESPLPPGPATPNPEPPAIPTFALFAMGSSDSQVGVAGYHLDRPLSVLVLRNGAPAAGIPVAWSTSAGTVSPRHPITDSDGMASADWVLGVAPGQATATAAVVGSVAKQFTFTAIAHPVTVTEVVQLSNFQSGRVALALEAPILAKVTHQGTPRAGVRVYWSVRSGTITASSVTNADGIASAVWTLGPTSGLQRGSAVADGNKSYPPEFAATGLPGPYAGAVAVAGNNQGLRSFESRYSPLVAGARDIHGNAVAAIPTTWTVEQGPVTLIEASPVADALGLSSALVAPVGAGGPAVVRATLPNNQVVRFTLDVLPRAYDIYFVPSQRIFASGRNRSSPAVDTVAVGTTVTWALSTSNDDDYVINSIGFPAFTGGGYFPYSNPSIVSATFSVPGTYRYAEGFSGAQGTIVVQ